MRRLLTLSLLTIMAFVSRRADATDRFFFDIEASSPSGRYQVTAKSPQNENRTGRVSFQSSFVYACTDSRTKELQWTRKQAMGKPETWGDDPKQTYTPALEGSPSSIYVSDSGFAVIYTGWNELVVVDPKGKDTVKIDILVDYLTEDEHDKYVSHTTAGPMWAGRSHWYFATADSSEYFIIRPWWGRHLIVDLLTGTIKAPTKSLTDATQKAEREYVLSELKTLFNGTEEKGGRSHKVIFAAYLAGVLRIQEAIPALRTIENSTYIGSSTSGGFGNVPEGRIDPFDYATYTTRQNVHLSLRRLGEKPGAAPCTIFKTDHKQYEKQSPYVRKPVPGTRESNAEKVKKGMSPEQVIDLIDCPDYIRSREWQYDIDSEKAYTLTISWTEERTAKKVKMVRPALWQAGTIRDYQH